MASVELIRQNKKGIDELIEELVQHRTWKYTLLVMSICITQFYSSTSAYINSFAGTDLLHFHCNHVYQTTCYLNKLSAFMKVIIIPIDYNDNLTEQIQELTRSLATFGPANLKNASI